MRKPMTAAAGLATAAALALPGMARGHVSLHPNTLPAGSGPTLYVRVPNEEDKGNTVKVDMQVPPGFTDVPTGYMPGWKAQVLTRKLATPVKTDNGTVTEEVSEIIWTGGKIPPHQFLQFPILATVPDNASGQTLTFKTIQTYDTGTVVSWIGPAGSDHPAPTVNVTAKGGAIQDIAGTEAGPPPPSSGGSGKSTSGTTTAKASSSDSASKGLGIAALILGILGVLIGITALVMRGRSRSGAAVG